MPPSGWIGSENRRTTVPSGAGGPTSSSFATAPDGAAAYAELLDRFDRPVIRLREPPSEADLAPASTLVLLDAEGLTQDDWLAGAVYDSLALHAQKRPDAHAAPSARQPRRQPVRNFRIVADISSRT